MTSRPRRARLRALAKINLSLKVLDRRPDSFHELRTVFQTISLADRIDVEFVPSRKTVIELEGGAGIPDNLIVRAARMAMDAMKATGTVRFRLQKKIPMGGGLGGGSTDAAATLLALPVLAGKVIELPELLDLAEKLGSDVPYFLLGGAAVGVGRGAEIYPLPDREQTYGILVAPEVHSSTADAYRGLGRELTLVPQSHNINIFQAFLWGDAGQSQKEGHWGPQENDFERVVFEQYPRLKRIKSKLRQLGAEPAMLTGSGAALFGFFRSRDALDAALESFRQETVFAIRTVSRVRYRSLWWKSLRAHVDGKLWPPRSRYAR